MNYPFFERIKERLDAKNKTIEWLAVELQKNPKTIYNNKLISEVALSYILNLTRLLEFDFLKDYNQWLVRNNEPAISVLGEPPIQYGWEKKITVGLKISGTPNAIGMNFSNMLKTVQKECNKYELEIE